MDEKQLDNRIITICNKIKNLRINAGYSSYEQFAWDNDINRVQYWRMEKGINFTMQSLLKVLDAHKITVNEFFKDLDI